MILFFICSFLTSCNQNKLVPSFDATKFESDKYQDAICFDLANDKNIFGGVISKSKGATPRSTIILPFEVDKVKKNRNIFNTWSIYENQTFIDFSFPEKDNSVTINFIPKWSDTKDKENNITWVSSGLRRTFVYQNKIDKENNQQFQQITNLNFIGINLPEKAEVFESRNKNNEIIKPEFEVSSSRFFSFANLEKQNKNQIQIEYMVEAADSQKETRDFLLKLAGIFLIPILQFVFMDKELADDRRKKMKRLFIWGGIGVQVIIFGIIGYLAYLSYQNGDGVPYYDLGLLLFGAIIEGIVLWIKMGAE